MKKSIILVFILFALISFTAFAQAPKQPIRNGNAISLQPKLNTTGITTANQKNGVSIIVLEATGDCALANLTAMTTIEQFLKTPNDAKSTTYKGLDASIADCCARSNNGTFVLRINFVDCNGNAIANRRPYEAVTRCSSKSSDLVPLIQRIIGAPSAGKTQYLKTIKVWQE